MNIHVRHQERLKRTVFVPAATQVRKTKTAAKPVVITPQREEELYDVYEAFEEQQALYETIFSATLAWFHWIYQNLRGTSNFNTTSEDDDLEAYWFPMSEQTNKIEIKPTTVVTEINALKRDIRINYRQLTAASFNDPNNPYLRFQKLLSTWIPKFQIPTDYVREGTRIVPVWGKELKSQAIPLEKLVSQLPEFEPISDKRDLNFEYYEGFQESFKGLVDFEFFVDISEQELREPYVDVDVNNGSLLGTNSDLRFKIGIRPKINWPKEYALWATNVYNEKDFNPVDFLWLANRFVSHETSDNSPGDVPNRISAISKVVADNKVRLQNVVREVKPRTTDDFCILRSGRIVWIPNVQNVQAYEKAQRQLYNPEDGTVDWSQQAKLVADMPIYADWLNGIFSYTDSGGNLTSIDLRGAIALDPVTLQQRLNDNFFSNYIQGFFDHYAKEMAAILNPSFVSATLGHTGQATYYDVGKMLNYLKAYAPDATFHQIMTADPNALESENPNEEVRFLEVCKLIRTLLTTADASRDKYALGSRVRSLEFLHYLLTNLDKMKELTELVAKKRQINSLGTWFSEENAGKGIELHNLPGIKSLIPHQADIYHTQKRAPDGVIYDIEPGGGKTVVFAVDIATMLAEGKIKRPLILCPGSLVKQVVSELNKFSQGQLNVFPIRRQTILKLLGLGWDRQKIVNYIRNLPPNTILITDPNFITSKFDIETQEYVDFFYYGHTQVERFPIIDFLLDCGFDFLCIDESHKFKNQEAGRTAAAAMLAAYAEKQRIGTGTLITDVATDLTGQVGLINPVILGSKAAFSEAIFIDGDARKGLLPGAAQAIERRMRPYTARVVKKRREWAFLLPEKINEMFWSVEMTPAQKQFYDNLMDDAMEEILADEKLMKKIRSGDEELAKQIENELKRYFAKVEIFINSPDSNAAFVATTDNPRDLVSPKVELIDQIIDYHFQGGNLRRPGSTESVNFIKDTSKVIVLGYNRQGNGVAKHAYSHSRHKSKAIYYSAGDDEALDRFKNDPKILILYADEESMKEGWNLQIAGRIIRLQTRWSPGDQEQAISRVMRPDVENKYDRKEISYDWILCNHSIEIAKTARIISKTIFKAMIDETNNPTWGPVEKRLENFNIEMLSMNLDAIKDFDTFGSLSEYFQAYTVLKSWQDKEFADATDSLKKNIFKATGRLPKDRMELIRLAMVPTVNKGVIPGSKKAYTPWVEGSIPYDERGFGLQPVSLVEDLDEEGDETVETEMVEVKTGQKVITEFGPGEILGISKKSLRIEVFGFGKVALPKSVVFVPSGEGIKKFDSWMKKLGKFGAPVMKKDGKQLNTKVAEPKDLPPAESEKETKPSRAKPSPSEAKRLKDRPREIDIYTSTLNGQVAVWSLYEDQDVDVLLEHGYRQHPTYAVAQIRNYSGAKKLMTNLTKKFDIPEENQRAIAYLSNALKGERGRLYETKPPSFKEIKNYFLLNSRKNKYDRTLKIWPLIWDKELYLVATQHIQPKAVRKLLTMPRVPGVEKFSLQEDFIFKLYPSPESAIKELTRINKKVKISDFDDQIEWLEKLKVRAAKKKVAKGK